MSEKKTPVIKKKEKKEEEEITTEDVLKLTDEELEQLSFNFDFGEILSDDPQAD